MGILMCLVSIALLGLGLIYYRLDDFPRAAKCAVSSLFFSILYLFVN